MDTQKQLDPNLKDKIIVSRPITAYINDRTLRQVHKLSEYQNKTVPEILKLAIEHYVRMWEAQELGFRDRVGKIK
jgi:hypothetical protein